MDRYDAFISYSHSEDNRLSRILCEQLQRFATSWRPLNWNNPVHSLRVFRDESALSANPALWHSIEQALQMSEWFILLASKDAATSPWIKKEIDYWRANKPKQRILLVLSHGEIVWSNNQNDFDWSETTALPRNLKDYFTQEPLWLDLRWTKIQYTFDRKDPRFQDAVAGIASPIRGVPKDQLIGADIRQHNKLNRWRNLAVISLSVLLITAIVAAELARQQRNLALTRETEAITQQKRAERQAEISLARQLAAQSVLVRLQTPKRIDLSLLLAVESMHRDPSFEARQALTQALKLTPKRTAKFNHRFGSFDPFAIVYDLTYSPDGQLLASVNEDGSLALWTADGDQVWLQPLSSENLYAIAFDPEAKILAAGGKEGRVYLVQVKSGEVLAELSHDGPINDLVFSPSGHLLATGSDDGTTRLWDVTSGRETNQKSFGEGDSATVHDLDFSPDGRYLAMIVEGGRVCLWDIDQDEDAGCMFTKGFGYHVEFDSRGKLLATASENFALVWDLKSRESIGPFEHSDLANDAKMAHFLYIDDIAFHPNGRFLATASRDGTVRLWDLENGQEALKLNEFGPVESIDFSPDGRQLATATAAGTVRIWEIISGREIYRISDFLDSTVQALKFSPDGSQLAAGSWWQGEIGVWSLHPPLEDSRLNHSDDVELITFDPSGHFFATATDDHMIHLWDARKKTKITEVRRFQPRRLFFDKSGEYLAIQSLAEGLEVFRIQPGSTGTLVPQKSPISEVKELNHLLLTRGDARHIEVWPANGKPAIVEALRENPDVEAFALHYETDTLAVAYNNQTSVEIGSIFGERQSNTIQLESRIFNMAINDDGDRLVIIIGSRKQGAARYGPFEYMMVLVSLADGTIIDQFALGEHRIALLDFLPDGKRVLVADDNSQLISKVRVVDTDTNGKIVALKDVKEARNIRNSPDGEYIAINDDWGVRIWNIKSGQVVTEIPTSGHVKDINFSADGRFLATASTNDDLTLWIWHPDHLLPLSCLQLSRNLTREEWNDFLPNQPYRATCENLPIQPD